MLVCLCIYLYIYTSTNITLYNSRLQMYFLHLPGKLI